MPRTVLLLDSTTASDVNFDSAGSASFFPFFVVALCSCHCGCLALSVASTVTPFLQTVRTVVRPPGLLLLLLLQPLFVVN